ncbi:hypothetical protein ACFWXO_24255, partial [Kitasatospora sp. NPDC059088]|uniref:hypothetical protein n=1 Tax=Kitasatospora sp. NPDC059088 TaxID=3346722 RepID=UPI0036952021
GRGAPGFAPRARPPPAPPPPPPRAAPAPPPRPRPPAEGPLRADLLAALRRGAPVPKWFNGPADFLASHARLDELTEGAAPAAAAFEAQTLSLAVAEDGPWRYLVVLPHDGGAPLLARGPRTA